MLGQSSSIDVNMNTANKFQLEIENDKATIFNYSGVSEWQHFNGTHLYEGNSSLINNSFKDNGEDRKKQIKELIREALKLERMIITKNPSSNSIDKERVLQNIRKNIVSLSETMFTKKALMLAIPMLFLI